MSGLGERGKRLRRLAEQLQTPPIAVYFVQLPDEVETFAIGWHMKLSRDEKPEYLGHSFIAAELKLRERLEAATKPKRSRAKAKVA